MGSYQDVSFGVEGDEFFVDESFRRSTPGKPSHQVKFAKGPESVQKIAITGQKQGGQVEKKPMVRRRGKAREGLLTLPPSITGKLFASYSTNKVSRDTMDTLLEAYVSCFDLFSFLPILASTFICFVCLFFQLARVFSAGCGRPCCLLDPWKAPRN